MTTREFDVVFLLSVFTHMLPAGVTQYMRRDRPGAEARGQHR